MIFFMALLEQRFDLYPILALGGLGGSLFFHRPRQETEKVSPPDLIPSHDL
jgi:hypothetical protein